MAKSSAALVDHCLRLRRKTVALKLGARGTLVAQAERRDRTALHPWTPVDATGTGDTVAHPSVAEGPVGGAADRRLEDHSTSGLGNRRHSAAEAERPKPALFLTLAHQARRPVLAGTASSRRFRVAVTRATMLDGRGQLTGAPTYSHSRPGAVLGDRRLPGIGYRHHPRLRALADATLVRGSRREWKPLTRSHDAADTTDCFGKADCATGRCRELQQTRSGARQDAAGEAQRTRCAREHPGLRKSRATS